LRVEWFWQFPIGEVIALGSFWSSDFSPSPILLPGNPAKHNASAGHWRLKERDFNFDHFGDDSPNLPEESRRQKLR
jgi:hypothetical protein